MLRLVSSKTQDRNDVWKPSKPCHVLWKNVASALEGFTLIFNRTLPFIIIITKKMHFISKDWLFNSQYYCLYIYIPSYTQLYQCWGYFCPMHKDAKIFENHLNPCILVFFEKLSPSALRWVPICQGFRDFSGFLHHLCIGQLSHQQHKVKISIGSTNKFRVQRKPMLCLVMCI